MTTLYHTMINTPNDATHIPVWMMRQAGRYLPEYRQLRATHSFLDMVYQPDIASEVTLQPIRRFQFDAAILFSDILVVPQALGMSLVFTDGRGPQFLSPIRSEQDVDDLSDQRERLAPIYETVRQVRQALPSHTALIGFAGAPFTVASYMIEGGTSKQLAHTKKMMVQRPELFHRILDRVTDITIDYLVQQCQSGAGALQIFDTWISHLDWPSCEAFSAQYVQRIVAGVRAAGVMVPITFFGKQTSVFSPLYAATGVNVMSIDWNGSLNTIHHQLPPHIGLQGNLDPFVLYGPLATIAARVRDICASVPTNRPFIFNLGHGLMPDIPIEAVQCVVDTVRDYSRP